MKENKVISPELLEHTCFKGKKCTLILSDRIRLERKPGIFAKYCFHVPEQFLALPEKQQRLFYAYWHRRMTRKSIYRDQRKHERILFEALRPSIRSRKRKIHIESKGNEYNLTDLLNELKNSWNLEQTEELQITWNSRPVKSYWGKYLPEEKIIVINRALDKKDVPKRILYYIIYHEYLHHVLGFALNQNHHIHHQDFKEKMKAFPEYRECELFLKEYWKKLFL